ncbi:acyl-CoA dehydrogenase [Streptomyces sp. TLI_053]|uniref:acyl-CoA dehydrogenase family protein n=1 Tax=Streptomyces sp. TLI_053 TaxID=1855352 RepID=UPI00087C7635|nr:acyl-CoA dehydrogenase family protein [Streptomyces sp. TLI_053]SDT83344.1 acyl-CoA dehydrogenase [Streptomyces sp. TLI_053]
MTAVTTDPLVGTARELAATVLARHAGAADRDARFPSESVAALRDAKLLGASAPVELGGSGASLETLVGIARALARSCGSTAMIWAMHQVQLHCACRYGASSPLLRELLRGAVEDQWLIASVTSERATGGDIGRSYAAVEVTSDADARVEKEATTLSYGADAGAYLLSARRSPHAAPGDQVAVLLRREDVVLSDEGPWQPLGMRATRSPGYRVRAGFGTWQIMDTPFHEIASNAMTPLSHVLWAAVWAGLATEAVERATRLARRRHHGGGPGFDRWSLAAAHRSLAVVDTHLDDGVRRADEVLAGRAAPTTAFAMRMNTLKIAVSERALTAALEALRVCGMPGYAETGEYSIARILRDLHSAPLMINNDRLLAANGELALLTRSTA